MTAAKTGAAEVVVEGLGFAPGELGDDLALEVVRQIGPGRARGAVEVLQRGDRRLFTCRVRLLCLPHQFTVSTLGHAAPILPSACTAFAAHDLRSGLWTRGQAARQSHCRLVTAWLWRRRSCSAVPCLRAAGPC